MGPKLVDKTFDKFPTVWNWRLLFGSPSIDQVRLGLCGIHISIRAIVQHTSSSLLIAWHSILFRPRLDPNSLCRPVE